MFEDKVKLNFPPKCKFYIVSSQNFVIKDYYPSVFHDLRIKCENTNILESLLNPDNYKKLMQFSVEQGGRSDSFVFSTSDHKYIIKTISKAELKVFIKTLLKSYIKRITEFPESKLVRIFGAFKIYPSKQSVIIMENIIHNKEKSLLFDLKGSRLDRFVKGIEDPLSPPAGVVLKDINFEMLGFKFEFTKTESENLIRTLKDDFEILYNAGIMDYSVLLAICQVPSDTNSFNRFTVKTQDNTIVSIGIIDLLQLYNLGKVGEKTVKAVFNKTEDISSTDPKAYFERISEFVEKVFA